MKRRTTHQPEVYIVRAGSSIRSQESRARQHIKREPQHSKVDRLIAEMLRISKEVDVLILRVKATLQAIRNPPKPKPKHIGTIMPMRSEPMVAVKSAKIRHSTLDEALAKIARLERKLKKVEDQ